jgi:hypothetical protein
MSKRLHAEMYADVENTLHGSSKILIDSGRDHHQSIADE